MNLILIIVNLGIKDYQLLYLEISMTNLLNKYKFFLNIKYISCEKSENEYERRGQGC